MKLNLNLNYNSIVLWNCNFNKLNFKDFCNLARHNFLKLPDDYTEMSKHVEVNLI
jgi:hypothetical protein